MGVRQSLPQRVEMFGFPNRGNFMILTGQDAEDTYERHGITYHFTQEPEEYPEFAVQAGVLLLYVKENDTSVVEWLARTSRVKAQFILVCDNKPWLKTYVEKNAAVFRKPKREPLLLTSSEVDCNRVCHFLE